MLGRRRLALIAGALAVLALAACGNDKEKEPSAGGGAKQVDVTVKEWSVAPALASVAAGEIKFEVKNEGPNHKHELVVVKTDLAPNALPTNANGSVNETGAGVTTIGEIEEFAVGEDAENEFDLTAGKYALFCNVVEETPTADMNGIKAHYKLGMFAAFTVT
jgi:uncharacterized cupredoxin-like copper-binding protein